MKSEEGSYAVKVYLHKTLRQVLTSREKLEYFNQDRHAFHK